MTTAAEAIGALEGIPEPCSIAMGRTMSLRAMGLVDSVVVLDRHVEVELVLTDASCVHYRSMQTLITAKLLELDGISSVAVTMSTQKLWTPDRLQSTSE